jgi:hypothetical protein
LSPRERVKAALGDEVEAGGYAGDLKITEVTFGEVFGEPGARVTAKTPEGGVEGVSCGDLDDGARAVFEKIYDDANWKGSAVLTYQGGLVDSSTGQDLPNAITGVFIMPPLRAEQIDWSDEDALSNIDWLNYRDYCHLALQ